MLGKNAVVDFGGTLYASLQTTQSEGQAQEITEEASTDGTGNATIVADTGPPRWTITKTLLMDGTATVPAALLPGTSGALKVYHFGDNSGLVEYDHGTAIISRHSARAGVIEHGKLDVTWIVNGSNPTIANVAP